MNRTRLICALIIGAGALLGVVGCEDDDDTKKSDWTGVYFLDEIEADVRHKEISLTASVSIKDHAMHIVTTKSGTGHDLRGTIDDTGYVQVVDAYDGELWSSAHDRATDRRIEINDWIYPEEMESTGWGKSLATIVLWR